MKTSIRFRPTLLRGLALLSIATAAVAVAPPADDAKARVAAGKNRFDALCVSCHGAAGTGVAPGSSAASYGPRLAGRTDLDPTLIHERIVRGKHGDKAMPPWGTVLDAEAIDQLTAYVKLIAATQPKAATHLTLSPYCDAMQTQAFLKRYKSDGPGSLVWTKLDEAVSFGSIVNVAWAAGLPVSALSYGAELKESLSPATEPLVWRLIFKRQLPGQAA